MEKEVRDLRTALAEASEELSDRDEVIAKLNTNIALLQAQMKWRVDSEEYAEVLQQCYYEKSRVDWLREVLRRRFPVPNPPGRGPGQWPCNLCDTTNGARSITCLMCGLPKTAFDGGCSSLWNDYDPKEWIPPLTGPPGKSSADGGETRGTGRRDRRHKRKERTASLVGGSGGGARWAAREGVELGDFPGRGNVSGASGEDAGCWGGSSTAAHNPLDEEGGGRGWELGHVEEEGGGDGGDDDADVPFDLGFSDY